MEGAIADARTFRIEKGVVPCLACFGAHQHMNQCPLLRLFVVGNRTKMACYHCLHKHQAKECPKTPNGTTVRKACNTMGLNTCFSCWLPNCHTKDCYKNGLGRDLSVLVLALTCDSPVGRCFFTAIQKTLLRQYQLRLADAPTGTENVDTRMKWFLTPVTAPDGRYKYYWPSHRDRPVTTGQIVVAFWVKGCMARGKRWDNSPPAAPCASTHR